MAVTRRRDIPVEIRLNPSAGPVVAKCSRWSATQRAPAPRTYVIARAGPPPPDHRYQSESYFRKDRAGRFTLANHVVAEIYGTTVDNLLGKTDADFNHNAAELAWFRKQDAQVLDTLQELVIAEEQLTDAAGRVRWLQTDQAAACSIRMAAPTSCSVLPPILPSAS
jgi:PAS domain S-box-containing protein